MRLQRMISRKFANYNFGIVRKEPNDEPHQRHDDEVRMFLMRIRLDRVVHLAM